VTAIRPDLTSFASTLARTDAPAAERSARGATDAPSLGEVGRAEAPRGPDFAERVEEALEEVNAVQVRAEEAAAAYANGERNDIHGTMIAIERADITFRLVSNVRSRLIEAYREVMRMGS
jgi:flagellar hook-basal body complex protein FliE